MMNHVDIIREVAREFCVGVEDIKGKDRHHSIAEARMVVMWLLRETGLSFPEIGNLLGRHHTTVMSGIRTIGRRYRDDRIFAGKVKAIYRRVEAELPGPSERLVVVPGEGVFLLEPEEEQHGS